MSGAVRLAALVESEGHACYRYRLEVFREHLAAAGMELSPCPIPRGWRARRALLTRLASSDMVFVQRKLFSWLERPLLRRAARRLVYELDDAVMYRDSYSRKGHASWQRRRRFAGMCRLADLVIAGNDFLATEARAYQANVHVVPTCVDLESYRPKVEVGQPGRLVLGWIGSQPTLQGLHQAADLLNAVGRHVPGVRLKLVSNAFFDLTDLPVDKKLWRAEEEAADLATFDVGISHIPDDVFSRGKCGLKLLQYMATGLPVVANPVGVHPEIVEDGRTGFLASGAEAWIDRIGRLAADPDLRRRMGQAGLERVRERYSTQVWGPRLARLLGALR